MYSDKLANDLQGSVKNIKKGTAGFTENIDALKSNFLFRGYFKKKAKEAERKKEEAKKKAEEKKTGKKENE